MRTLRARQSPFTSWATLLLGLVAGCAPSDSPEPSGAPASAPTPQGADGAGEAGVRTGAEVLLSDSLHLVRGRRVGLVTNHTGIVRVEGTDSVVSVVDLLHGAPGVDLVALYGPEHGLSGAAEAGEQVASGRHPGTGLPVYSLYGETREPLPHMLQGIDVLLFDIQDVGARYYTYVSTMALAMRAAAEAGIPFVVLDRPNPIDGIHVQGNVLDPAFATFVGMFPVPMRHGMTPGELARLFRGAFGVPVSDLRVVPAEGWERDMTFDETGLPWVAPSPNMPSLESALHYPGTCLFEGTNLSVGRGTDLPFQQIGAPWLDGATLAERLNGHGIPGVRFEAVTFTPRDPGDRKHGGVEVEGVRFVATDARTYDPTLAAVAALVEARRMSGEEWEWRVAHFDRLAGTDRLRPLVDEGTPPRRIAEPWQAALDHFRGLRDPYLLY